MIYDVRIGKSMGERRGEGLVSYNRGVLYSWPREISFFFSKMWKMDYGCMYMRAGMRVIWGWLVKFRGVGIVSAG